MDGEPVMPSRPAQAVPHPAVPRLAGCPRFENERVCVLTLHTLFRRPVFRDAAAAGAVAALVARTLPFERAAWLAWVLLPDQWQGLLAYGADESLPALVGRFKAMTTRAVAPRHRINGWLWGRGHRGLALAGDASLSDVAMDLVAAPRRAGLVASLRDWPYWESAWGAAESPARRRGTRRLIDPAGAPTIDRCRSP